MAALAQVTGGMALAEAESPTTPRPTPADRLAPDRPPRGRSGGGMARRLSDGVPPRYSTANCKQRMLEVAVQVATRRGYEALRISEITDPVGVTRQAFYAHFRDKRHCLCEAIDPSLAAVERIMAGIDDQNAAWAVHLAGAIDLAISERFGTPAVKPAAVEPEMSARLAS